MQTKQLKEKKFERPGRREELRQAALRLFAERSYAAVSIRDIAQAVGIVQGGVYNHFASKQELLADLMVGHMETLLAALNDAMAGVKGPANRLEAFARFHVRYHLDHPDDVFIAYMELRSLEPDNLAVVTALRDRYERALRAILEEGKETGAFSILDSAVQTRALTSMLTGVTVWYHEGGRLGREAVIECYVQTALQAAGCQKN